MSDEPYPAEPQPEVPAPELPAQPGERVVPQASWGEGLDLPRPRDLDAEPARGRGVSDEVGEEPTTPPLDTPRADVLAADASASDTSDSDTSDHDAADELTADEADSEEEGPEIRVETLERLLASEDRTAPPAETAFSRWRAERRHDLRPRVAELEEELASRTEDLQRLQAEFQNYRRRMARERDADRDRATGAVLTDLLPVLDDLARARSHGDLHGPLAGIMEALLALTTRLGLERFGEAGELFDPEVHEALQHSLSPEATETVCAEVFMPGYRHEGRLLRPARVHVVEPDPDAPVVETADGL